jgi:hypothetical protein
MHVLSYFLTAWNEIPSDKFECYAIPKQIGLPLKYISRININADGSRAFVLQHFFNS